jgi:hypothetical protein
MQITAGSLTGAFGRTAQYWAQRMLEEGCVHVLATDAHDVSRRPPVLSEGREQAAVRVGAGEAEHLVVTRPLGVLGDAPPANLPAPVGLFSEGAFAHVEARSMWGDRREGTRSPTHDHARSGHRRQRLSDRLRRFFD